MPKKTKRTKERKARKARGTRPDDSNTNEGGGDKGEGRKGGRKRGCLRQRKAEREWRDNTVSSRRGKLPVNNLQQEG